jgi:hypothetical protein
MAEGEEQRDILREHLGELSRVSRREEIMNMSLEDKEKELAKPGRKPKPEYDLPITEEELLAGIEATARAVDTNLRRRVERVGATPSQVVKEAKKKKVSLLKEALALLLLGLTGYVGHLADAVPAYNCNRSNIVESYSSVT